MDRVKEKVFFSFFFLLLFLCENVGAQHVEGKVVNDKGEPISFATVIVQTMDSAFVNGTLTDTIGIFRVMADIQTYRLTIQHLQFENCTVVEDKKDVGIVILKEKENLLDELVVKGQRPLVKMEQGKLTYDVGRVADAKVVSNAYELLSQLPGVREQNGDITLVGANGVTIILNGKPTSMTGEQLMNLLKNMPISRIEKAEVMYSAPPKYHVRGAVINLVVKGYQSGPSHLQGEVNGTYAQKYNANASGGVSLLYLASKFTADLLYNADYNNEKQGMDLYSTHAFHNQMYDIEQFNRGYSKSLKHNIRVGTDYLFTEKDKLSFAYTATLSPNIKKAQLSGGNYSTSVINKQLDEFMHNIAIDYTSRIGLNAGLNYTRYHSPATQDFSNIDRDGGKVDFIVNASQSIDRWKAYIDQTQQMRNDWALNYGATFSYAKERSSQIYQTMGQGDFPGQNTDSKVKEHAYNVYAGVEKSFDKVSMSLSVAGEYYQLGGYENWAVYPALQLTYIPAVSHVLQFSFSSDKLYPDYWEMQNAVNYLNGYAELHGNPFLRPSKDYSVQLAYVLKSKYIVNTYCNNTTDYFQQLPYQSSERLALIYQTVNFDYRRQVGLSVVVPFKIKDVLDSRLTLDGSYNKVKSANFHEISFDANKFVGYMGLDNTLKISSKPDIKLEIAAAYMSPLIQGIYELSSLWRLDVGGKWTSSNKRTEIRVKGSDLFNSFTPDAAVNYKNQNLSTFIKPDKRAISLSVTYKFGGYKAQKRKQVDVLRFGIK